MMFGADRGKSMRAGMWMSGLGQDDRLPRRRRVQYRLPIWSAALAIAGALALVSITQDAVARRESAPPLVPASSVAASPAPPVQLAGPVASDIVAPAPKPSDQL